MTKLSSLDLWRLSESLSVVDAAILIAGFDPSQHYNDNDGDRVKLTWQHEGFEPAFNALRGAIKTNKLRANLAHAMRGRQSFQHGDYFGDVDLGDDEHKVSFDMLIARNETVGYETTQYSGETKLNFAVENIINETGFCIWKEPNWNETTIDVNDLRNWLIERGVYPSFFFPSGNRDSFSNPKNPRYSAKLACAVGAWEAVEKPSRGKSVKKTIQDWVQSNGVSFGLGEDGVVSPTAAEEIAKIANWNPKGGANPTPQATGDDAETLTREPNNYEHGYNSVEQDDGDIPF
ncbi:hypothetical protein [Sulfitobacter pacificus]|uniref:Uncharacterized protein n=1 Tax=Sulfitobacter pacificus TaxID=1499314 RepID=A0ABQ5VFK5_9RHOB|nr:hypothetical protein [Sulfitobacter pacificus]GLQ25778.1 hypothetical protein GCM10007927_05810 [Sulfitobacter pacificus]